MKNSGKVISFLSQRTKILTIVFLLFIAAKIPAQSFAPTNLYAGWNGSTAFATIPLVSGLTFSQISRGPGINAPAPVTSGITSQGWDGTTSLAQAETANKYFAFSITSNATAAFNISSLGFFLQRSATGPNNFQMEYSINGGPFATFGNPFSNTSTSSFFTTMTPVGLIFVPGGQNIVFRLYGWGATGSTGTCRINNNSAVNGTVYSVTTTSIGGSPFCVNASTGSPATVNYSATGTYAGTNVFTAQLSDASGSFASPVAIGTLNGNAASGTINATIPAGTTPGTGYRIRIISSAPAVTGVDNGSNISIGTSMSVTTSVTNLNCNGTGDGAISTTVTGTPPITYSWSTGATTSGLSGLSGGTYTLTVTDNGGCAASVIPITVIEPAVLTASITAVDISCNGLTNGATNLTVNGGTSPYNFAWSNSATTQNLSGLSAGTYSVNVTDSHGCTQNTSATIIEPSLLSVSASFTNVNCGGGSDGTASLTVNGGTFPYSYSWSNSATTQNLSGLTAGTYSVIVSDNHGCTQNATVTLTAPAGMTISASSTNVNCNGGITGTANLTVSGGASPYSYSWSNSATTQNISGLAAGTYSVIISDNNGCSQNTSVTITEPTVISISASSTDVNCNGGNNGTANLSVSGGTSPYGFAWNNSATTQNLSSLMAGTYSVIVTDNNGCTQNSSVTITEPTVLAVSSSSTNVNCNAGNDATANLTVSGGTLPYSFAWNNSATTQNLSALSAGTYSVIVTDNHGCTQNSSVTITEPAAISVSPSSTDVSCNGGNTGSVNLAVNGGTSPYSYLWSNSEITQNISGLSAGTYSVIVTDNHGCTQNSSVTIAEPSALVILPGSTNVNCNGATTGSANLTVIGGTSPYSYSWSNSAITQNISGLSAGTYSVIVTDNHGCTQNSSVTITEPTAITVSSNSTDETCNGGTIGTADLTVSGGTSPYSYSWSNSATTQNLSALSAGTYSVIITDNHGCTHNTSVTITEPTAIAVSPVTTNVNCNGGNTGATNLSVNGGTSPYSFSWSNSAITQNISGLSAGTYSVVVTDNNGCTQNASVTITESSVLAVSPSSSNVNCNGGNTGTANLSVSGGTSPYSYSWSNSAITQNISGLSAGTYSVVVTDNNGCTQNASVTITEPSVLAVSPSSSNVNCNGGNTGTANLSVSGGTSPYSYSWSNTATTQNLSGLSSGTYSVVVTDNSGCTQNSSVTITEPSPVTSSSVSFEASCATCADGSIDLTVNGGTTPYAYSWSNSAGTQDINSLLPGMYYVTITDGNGCQHNDSTLVNFSTGIAGVDVENEINVYPNPSNGENIHLVFHNQNSVSQKIEFSVFDMSGKEVYKTELNGNTEYQMNVLLENGTYIYKIENQTGFLQSGRLVILK